MTSGSNYGDAAYRLFSLFRSVAEDYVCLIDVDLQTQQETQFILRDGIGETLPKWSDTDDYTASIAAYAEKVVSPEDRDRFVESTRLKRLLDTLEREREYIIDYEALLSDKRRHFQGRFILGKTGSGEAHMYVGIRDITETAKYETRSREIAEYQRYSALLHSESHTKRTVLVIEDNELEREMLRCFLSEWYNVLEAENGRTGFELLRRQYERISLVLLDVHMPVMDGHEFLRAAQKDPLLKMIPAIVMTGDQDGGESELCRELGASDFLPKPYSAKNVITRVENIIKLRETAATLAAVEYDDLTGLRTRQSFFHHAQLILKSNPEKKYSLLVSDIQGFRQINKNYGSEVGDDILLRNAEVLKQAADRGILVGRLESDKFVSLMEFDTRYANAEVLEAVCEQISLSFPIPGVVLKFGIYDDVDHNLPVSQICDRAIMGLKSVKHRYGELFGRYSDELQKAADKEHSIEADMRTAYETGQFRVYYQPKHDAVSGRLTGAEALIRWEHPEYGIMSPGEFIPLFEKTGFISWADFYVWKRTCENLRRWMDKGLSVVPVSVNASRLDFHREDFLEKINGAVQSNGISPQYLHVEITETVFLQDPEKIVSDLNLLRENGYQIELDDFGSGYSTLNSLADLPLDYVKLDMSFMRQIHNPRKNRVLSACISLAKGLKLGAIVEGVETQEQLDMVRRSGVDSIQGYYYSKPLCEEDFEKYLADCMLNEARDIVREHDSVIEMEPEISSAGGFLVYGAGRDGRLIYADNESCRQWGCRDLDELRTLCSNSVLNLVHPDDLRMVLSSICGQVKENPTHMAQVRCRIRTKDGTVKWVYDYSHVVRHDLHGYIFYVFLTDIPEKFN